jgi:membrane protease YdiL (CAAX protease family)
MESAEKNHWRFPGWRVMILALVIGCVQSMIAIAVQWKLGVLAPRNPPNQMLSVQTLKIWIFVGGLIQAPLEEWLFRGVVLKYLSRWIGPVFGLLLSSAAFSLAHGVWHGAASRFFFGLTLGALYLTTRSLWPSSVAHYATNVTTVATVLWLTSDQLR